MKVKIKTPCGRMSFNMPSDKAMELLRLATEYAKFNDQPASVVKQSPPPKLETVRAVTDPLRAEPATMVLDRESGPAPATEAPGKMAVEKVWHRVTPVEPMKVNEDGTIPVMGTEVRVVEVPAPKPKEPPKSRVENMFGSRETWNKPQVEKKDGPPKSDNFDGYRGFLYIKCDECGEEKGFCVKSPIVKHRCEKCGHSTDLRDLLPMFVKCKCGAEFKYQTNMVGHEFTINCLRCGAPIDMRLNGKETAFVTVDSLRR